MGFSKIRVWLARGAIAAVLLVVVSLAAGCFVLFGKISSTPQIALILQLGLLFLNLLILLVLLLAVLTLLQVKSGVVRNTEVHKDIAVSMDKNHSLLAKIDQNTHLSERAKSIAFREADTHSLREIVFNKLHQKDFDAAFEIVDEIANIAGYKKLAAALRYQATQYQNATDQERENQVIAHIDKLIESYEWQKAHGQIEKLRWSYPESKKVEMIAQKLIDKRTERKKVLLVAWDSAVQRQDTDRCIEILTELDQYLTPTEGLALQESARDVFRTKLHNLGVRFSLAVSERQWPAALDVGRQIMKDFPNSRMSEEIRSRINILSQRVKQQV